MKKKIVLIDGNSIVNRAFYGVPDLSNSEGFHTNAIFGFLNILFKILDEEKPDYLTVAFDLKAPTFRHKMYEAYKGTRKPMPEELREQIPVLKELLSAMGIAIIQMEGYEADDLLGTLAKRSEKEGLLVTLVSGDRDLLQIATDDILIRIPKTKGGKTEIEDYHTQEVIDKYGVPPLGIIELKALMGDASDNIPGVPKIGEKTATELLKQYGNIENLKEHIEEITKKSIKETLTNNFDLAVLSKKLATIEINAPVEINYEDMTISSLYTKEAYEIVKKLGFKNMLSKFENLEVEDESSKIENILVNDLSQAEEVFSNCASAKKTGFYVLADKEVKGISLCFDNEKSYFILNTGFITEGYLVDKLCKLIANGKDSVFYTFDVKNQFKYLSEVADDRFIDRLFDIKIAAYLNNPLKNDYAPEDVANEYLGMVIKDYAQVFGKKTIDDMLTENTEAVKDYAGYISFVCFMAADMLTDKLDNTGMLKLFKEIEMPLTICLYDMEKEGILVKPDELKAYGEELQKQINTLEGSIHEAAGCDFNINSPKQLGEVLFEKMGLKGGKKTKTGYSTAADVLEKLAEDSPFVADILKYRGLAKLKSTYADGLLGFIDDNNRIHSTFTQTITATGRLSSTDPNLQNIPIREEQGRLIRKVFVPKDGYVFLDADYSQIELRILAHMSGDEKLIEAYNREDDIHRITASEVFNTPFEEVTDIQRRNAKAVNFGIIYGISSFGLSQDLSISRKDAKDYIDKYFETYPQVKSFIDSLVNGAKENGYALTMYGRRRPIPELNSSNFMQRQFGERVAMNAPIQGSAADIMKIAMLRVYRKLKENNLKSKIILQVHDELLIETAKEEEEIVGKILTEEMKNAAQLKVSLEVDMHAGLNWYSAK